MTDTYSHCYYSLCSNKSRLADYRSRNSAVMYRAEEVINALQEKRIGLNKADYQPGKRERLLKTHNPVFIKGNLCVLFIMQCSVDRS